MVCPKRAIYDNPGWYSELFQLYGAYDKGVLLRRGSMEDQPQLYLNLMSVVGGAVADVQEFNRSSNKPGSTPGVKRVGRQAGR